VKKRAAVARPLKHFRSTLSAQRLKSQFAFRWVVASSSPVELLGWDCTLTREQIAMPQIERNQLRRRDGHVSRACTYLQGIYVVWVCTRVYVHACRRIELMKWQPQSRVAENRDANEGMSARGYAILWQSDCYTTECS